eukprot:11044302-Karenia_brevis.AAC.1
MICIVLTATGGLGYMKGQLVGWASSTGYRVLLMVGSIRHVDGAMTMMASLRSMILLTTWMI